MRDLADALIDLLAPFATTTRAGVRVRQVHLELPIEVSSASRGPTTSFHADVPAWRWPTDFDRPRSRLVIVAGEMELP